MTTRITLFVASLKMKVKHKVKMIEQYKIMATGQPILYITLNRVQHFPAHNFGTIKEMLHRRKFQINIWGILESFIL